MFKKLQETRERICLFRSFDVVKLNERIQEKDYSKSGGPGRNTVTVIAHLTKKHKKKYNNFIVTSKLAYFYEPTRNHAKKRTKRKIT